MSRKRVELLEEDATTPESSDVDVLVDEEEPDGRVVIDRRSKETRLLSCLLTEPERRERADSMSECLEQQGKLEAELDGIKASYKAQNQELEGRLQRAQTEYRTGFALRDVDVERVWSLTENRYYETRLDTGEVITERPLTETERQSRFA